MEPIKSSISRRMVSIPEDRIKTITVTASFDPELHALRTPEQVGDEVFGLISSMLAHEILTKLFEFSKIQFIPLAGETRYFTSFDVIVPETPSNPWPPKSRSSPTDPTPA